jgi:hypothetical protein
MGSPARAARALDLLDDAALAVDGGGDREDAEERAKLTGMTHSTCVGFHEQQLANLMHGAYNIKHLVIHASFLDRCPDPGI